MNLILSCGKFYTMDKDNPHAEAVAIKDGIIKAVVSDADILKLKTENTEIVELNGKAVVPGFNDSHFHMINTSGKITMVDLAGTGSIDELINRFKEFIKENNIAEGTVVIGSGWSQSFFKEKRDPTRYDLDKISDAHPIIAVRACYHICSLSSLALIHYGIDKDTAPQEGGEIVKDENGEPNGILCEHDAWKVYQSGDAFSIAELEERILIVVSHLSKMGITSVHSDDFSERAHYNSVYNAYVNLAKAGKLNVRVSQKCRSAKLDDYKKMLELPQVDESVAPYFKLNSVKIMADGGLGARTAYLKEDYHDDPGNRGMPLYTKEEFEAIVELAHEKDMPVAVHAIGDETIEWCMDAVKKAQRKSPKPNIRHGIIHCTVTDKKLLDDFKDNNIVAYVQPIFIDMGWDFISDRVGAEKSATIYAFKSLMDMGVKIPFGSDSPVETYNPFKNIYCAVTRKGLQGLPGSGFNPTEALSVHEAVYAYTTDGAYASYEEDVKGIIKPGMYADMAVLERDIFESEPERLKDTEVEMTIFDGKIVYKK